MRRLAMITFGKMIVALSLIFGGCHQTTETQDSSVSLYEVVARLETVDEKRIFLENIHDTDQEHRLLEPELLQNHGYGSEEVETSNQLMMNQDLENLNLIRMYLELHKYPSLAVFGKKAANTPWLVIHHSMDTELRRLNFKVLQKAYADGNIDETAFALYLERTWMLESGEGFDMESPYRMNDKIDRLIEALGLDAAEN